MKAKQLEVLVNLVNMLDKHKIKVEVVEVEDSPTKDENEDKEEHQEILVHIFDSNVEPLVNWDEVNMGRFCRMAKDGTHNLLSLVKWLFSEVKELNVQVKNW